MQSGLHLYGLAIMGPSKIHIKKIASTVIKKAPGFAGEFLKVFPTAKSVGFNPNARSLWTFIYKMYKSGQPSMDAVAAAIKILLNNFYLYFLDERKLLEYTHRELTTFSVAGNKELFKIYQMISMKAKEKKQQELDDYFENEMKTQPLRDDGECSRFSHECRLR